MGSATLPTPTTVAELQALLSAGADYARIRLTLTPDLARPTRPDSVQSP